MDVDSTDYVAAINAARDESANMWLDEPEENPLQATQQALDPAVVLVLDTNILLSHLDLLKEAVQALEKQLVVSSPSLAFIVPSVVLRELDSLKASTKPVDRHRQLGFLARSAHAFLLAQASAAVSLLRFQRKAERHALDLVAPTNDALILDAALYFHQQLPGRVGVLSNDNNLCIQALAEQLPALSLQKQDRFQHLLQALHPDLPAQFGYQIHHTSEPSVNGNAPFGSHDDDMDMTDSAPSNTLADISPESILSSISTTLSSILPHPVYSNLVFVQGQDTTDYLLKSHPPPDRWNAATALDVLEKHWSSLEHLWDTYLEVDNTPASSSGSGASRWSSPPVASTSIRRPAKDGLGLSRSQLRDFRQNSLRSLARLCGSKRGSSNGSSLASYATSQPTTWRASQWSTLWVDLELLLLRGRLLQSRQAGGEADSRHVATSLLQEWRQHARHAQQLQPELPMKSN